MKSATQTINRLKAHQSSELYDGLADKVYSILDPQKWYEWDSWTHFMGLTVVPDEDDISCPTGHRMMSQESSA